MGDFGVNFFGKFFWEIFWCNFLGNLNIISQSKIKFHAHFLMAPVCIAKEFSLPNYEKFEKKK